jgi:DNA-directed RNA polymerase specialized sigma24 family protein
MAEEPPLEDKISPEQSDRSLLRRFRAGQSDAATLLYLRYADRLRALAAVQSGSVLKPRVDPEDIVQSVFRTFFRRAARGEYDVPEGEELWKLFLIIALNKVRATGAHHRAAKRDVRMTQNGAAFDQAMRNATSRDEASLLTLRLVVEGIMDKLVASQRVIIEKRIEGYQVEEIARQTGRARRSVERALQDFRKTLTRLLNEEG